MVNIRIKTVHGYLSLQPTGAIEFRDQPGPWETFTLEGLPQLSVPPAGPPAGATTSAPPLVSPPSAGTTGSTTEPVMTDAIDLAQAVIPATDCPDVRRWPVRAPMTLVEFAATERFERGDTMVDFTGRDALPPAMGTQGPIAYTLWMGCRILNGSGFADRNRSGLADRAGTWYIAPIVECIRAYVPTGRLLAPNQVATNLLYYPDPPLRGYQPAPGEQIALFCTTGDTRRQNAQAIPVPWRTNVVLVPFAVGRHERAAFAGAMPGPTRREDA